MIPPAGDGLSLHESVQYLLSLHPRRRDTVIFPPSIGWDPPYLFQRPQQLARALARAGCVVFYVEPEYSERRSDGFHEVEERLYVCCVPLLVFSSLLEPAAVVYPYNTTHLRFLRSPRIIYDVIDSLELWGGDALVSSHRDILSRARVVTASSRHLLADVSPLRSDALYTPNGADADHFSPGPAPRPVPPDLAPLVLSGCPIIGYTGALARWFDYALLKDTAAALPEAQFVLIGSDHDGSLVGSGVLNERNVHWMGPKPYGSLPAYVEYFDAGIIPFILNDITAATSPVKLFEYLAAQKPVVSTPLPECLLTPLVFCSSGREDFPASIRRALELRNNEGFKESASALARENSWDRLASRILEALSEPGPSARKERLPGPDLSSGTDVGPEGAVTDLRSLVKRLEKGLQELAFNEQQLEAAETSRASRPSHPGAPFPELASRNSELIRELEAGFRLLEDIATRTTRDVEHQVSENERVIANLTISLASITSSLTWRALQVIWRTRLALAPRGSRRERAIWRVGHFIRSTLRAGSPPSLTKVFPSEVLSEPRPGDQGLSVPGSPKVTPPRMESQAGAPSRPRRKHAKASRPRVAYLTNQLLDPFTNEPRFGGGERYCITLSGFLKDHGFDVTLFQSAGSAFEGRYYGLPVIGIPLGKAHSEFQYGVCDAFFDVSKRYDFVIHNLPEYASGRVWQDAILICHGIWFDHENYAPPIVFRTAEWYGHLHRAFSQPGHVVSVDTNSINVIRSLWPELAGRMMYIPNWVDIDRFHPAPGQADSKVVLFPRRSQVNRGSRILRDILKLVPHSDWRFRWVGDGDSVDTQIIKDLALEDPRLEYRTAPFDEMPAHYQTADICVIPTIACEGTSLSCLEALASGNAVVSTNVGGLPDLVQPGVNGLLVEPTAGELAGAINWLIERPADRAQLRQRAMESARYFRLDVWRERWLRLLGRAGWLNADGRPA